MKKEARKYFLPPFIDCIANFALGFSPFNSTPHFFSCYTNFREFLVLTNHYTINSPLHDGDWFEKSKLNR